MTKEILFGIAVGDALGVPVEFIGRDPLRQKPVTDMIGYGTYHLPPGTWSDDSSLAFCLAEALTHGFDLNIIADYFQKWLYEKYWTPYGKVFDVGITTQQAIYRFRSGVSPELAGGFDESENGNGSLMRILPLVLHVRDKPIDERFTITKMVSSITHGHIRSVIACFFYLEFASELLKGEDRFTAYRNVKASVSRYLLSQSVSRAELRSFDRLLNGDIHERTEDEIQSSGYVVHTLEAGIWCLLTTETYREAVLKAVNLGYDTDTTGAVTGGLAGVLYGFENIPESWVNQLARRRDIDDLAMRLALRFGGRQNRRL